MTDTDSTAPVVPTAEQNAITATYVARFATDQLRTDSDAYAQARGLEAVAWWLRAIHEELVEARKAAERRP